MKIQFTLLGGVAVAALSISASAFAQEAGLAAEEDAIVVTGTRARSSRRLRQSAMRWVSSKWLPLMKLGNCLTRMSQK
jgi:hypothetical protein